MSKNRKGDDRPRRLFRNRPKAPADFHEAIKEVDREDKYRDSPPWIACQHVIEQTAGQYVKIPDPQGEFVVLCGECFSKPPEESLVLDNLGTMCPCCVEKMVEGMTEIPWAA